MNSTTDQQPEELGDFLIININNISLLKKVSYFIAGLILIAVGFIGWVLPVLIGLPLIFMGLVFIGLSNNKVGLIINHIDKKLPYTVRKYLRKMKRNRKSS